MKTMDPTKRNNQAKLWIRRRGRVRVVEKDGER
uniref:Uncharacterized protein n=1 Tax=Cucumis melo TaxID=3656 RepID=A0A9I9E420_CUCME